MAKTIKVYLTGVSNAETGYTEIELPRVPIVGEIFEIGDFRGPYRRKVVKIEYKIDKPKTWGNIKKSTLDKIIVHLVE